MQEVLLIWVMVGNRCMIKVHLLRSFASFFSVAG